METTTLPFVTARIDLQGLSHDLGVFKDKLEDWADRVVVKTETEKMEHANELRVLAESISKLKKQQERLQREAQEVRKRMESEGADVAGIEKEIGAIRERLQALPAAVAEVQRCLDAEAHALWKKKAVTESKEGTRRQIAKGLEKVLDAYKDRLGLVLEDEAGTLRIVFTHVDVRHPEEEFSVTVDVGDGSDGQGNNDGGVYSVVHCEPMIDDVQALVDELNASGNFSMFVVGLRNSFITLTAANSTASSSLEQQQ